MSKMNRLKRKLWTSKYGWTKNGLEARKMLKNTHIKYSELEMNMIERRATLKKLEGYKKSMEEGRFLLGKNVHLTAEELIEKQKEIKSEMKDIQANMSVLEDKYDGMKHILEKRHNIKAK